VVICADTEDRWDDLVAAVTSVKQQTRRPAEIVLVIDHNPKLQRRSTFELPGVKVIPNDNEKGLPGCRNAGIAAATAGIVAFLDDETVAAHNWLAALVAPYADPHVLGVGGQVVPVWQPGRPGWFPPEFDWVVGCSYRGMPAERTLVYHFIGGNMSLRRRLLVECGGFDAALSGISTRRLACEETKICVRLERRHPDGVYLCEPKALVRYCRRDGTYPRCARDWHRLHGWPNPLAARCEFHARALADNDRTRGGRIMTAIPILLYHSVSIDPPRGSRRIR
jgi:glycosyltransferase involved in cell wall biosynthesis